MRKIVTAALLLLALTASWAMALDLRQHLPGVPQSMRHVHGPSSVNATLGCDDGVVWSGYYQGQDDRLGNVFDFGSGATLTRVGFLHYGFGTAGPYTYDIDLWDPTSCTFIASKKNLTAADAASSVVFEDVDFCPDRIQASGSVLVAIHPRSCNSPTDCYPDLLFDDELNVACPWIINSATTAPVCWDPEAESGPFLLRIELDNCPVPALKTTWGKIKSIYR